VSRVSARGVTVTVPPGWDVRIYRREPVPPEVAFTVAHLANFPLPAGRGDYGNGAVDVMGPSSVLVCLLEHAPEQAAHALFSSPGAPKGFEPGDFHRTTLQHARAGQVGVQRFFNTSGRAWALFAVLGSDQRLAVLVPQVNQVLASLEIGVGP